MKVSRTKIISRNKFLGYSYRHCLIILCTLALTGVLTKFIGLIFGRLVQVGLLTFVLLIGYPVYKRMVPHWRAIFLGFTIAVSLISVYWAAGIVQHNFSNPYEWDFLTFYLHGHVVVQGLNFYQPQNYQQIYTQLTLPFTPGHEFILEVVNVGLKYPPPRCFISYL